jgi:hypothetical protein
MGKFLGIYFYTVNQTWNLQDDKRHKTISAIHNSFNLAEVTTLQMQSVTGRLSFISSMCPFLHCFKFNLNNALANAILHESTLVNSLMMEDLRKMAKLPNKPRKMDPNPL